MIQKKPVTAATLTTARLPTPSTRPGSRPKMRDRGEDRVRRVSRAVPASALWVPSHTSSAARARFPERPSLVFVNGGCSVVEGRAARGVVDRRALLLEPGQLSFQVADEQVRHVMAKPVPDDDAERREVGP